MSMVMGFGAAPYCVCCLAELLGQPSDALAHRLFDRIRQLECHWGAWLWTSSEEQSDPQSVPTCSARHLR